MKIKKTINKQNKFKSKLTTRTKLQKKNPNTPARIKQNKIIKIANKSEGVEFKKQLSNSVSGQENKNSCAFSFKRSTIHIDYGISCLKFLDFPVIV